MAMAKPSVSQNPSTLLSTIQKIQSSEARLHASHPFASSSDASITLLHDMLDTMNLLTHSLNIYMSIPISNPKLVSLLRQHATISHNIYVVRPFLLSFSHTKPLADRSKHTPDYRRVAYTVWNKLWGRHPVRSKEPRGMVHFPYRDMGCHSRDGDFQRRR